MAQELKCVHRCDREKCPNKEEVPVGTFLGIAKKPRYPQGWVKIEDKEGKKYALCPDCTDEHYNNVDKFIKGKKSEHN